MNTVDAKLAYINGKPFWEAVVTAIFPEGAASPTVPDLPALRWLRFTVEPLTRSQAGTVVRLWKETFPEVAGCFKDRQADYIYAWRSLPCFSRTSDATQSLKTELHRRKRARNWR